VRYLDSIRFVYAKKNWLMNMVMCVICMIIPVVGQIVLMGYMFEVLDFLRREPNNPEYPDFKFDRFVPYLMRGIWPFLVQIVASFVIGIVISVMVGLLMMAMFTRSSVIISLAWLLCIVAITIVSVALSIVLWPAMFYAGISQQLNPGATVAFVKDFMKRVGKELVLSVLFLIAAGIVLGPVGLCACFIGVWFVAIGLTFSHYHLEYQLYELYLQRGGTPIPVKGEPAGVPGGDLSTAITAEPERRTEPPAAPPGP
jgi:hypothetical protein